MREIVLSPIKETTEDFEEIEKIISEYSDDKNC